MELGLGPLHTAFDGRGNAYTTLFLDSQVVKWNVEAAIKFHKGDKNAKYVVDRIDVQYQPGHLNASQSETIAADGKYLAVGCKFSKDRFLPAGPLHPENEQLIDISGDKMVLLADHPVRGEPHDFIIFKRELVKPKQVYTLDDSPIAVKDSKESGVVRNGRKVTVKLTSLAPSFSLREFNVKKGDEVTLILTNLDKIEDLTHGFAIPHYNVNFIVNPQETKSVTFMADKPGVFWAYCTLLPRAAPGNAQPHDRRGLRTHLKPRASRAGLTGHHDPAPVPVAPVGAGCRIARPGLRLGERLRGQAAGGNPHRPPPVRAGAVRGGVSRREDLLRAQGPAALRGGLQHR